MGKTYKHILIGLGITCLLLLPITYGWFVIGGPFPTGEGISKGDWLGFWGGYLSFVGATILGTIAVWQNNQANKTNQTAIEENRRIYQIGFENELRKAKYLAIIHAIEELNTKLVEINKNFLSLLHEAKNTHQEEKLVSAYSKTIESLNFMASFEFDQILPISFDKQYPEIKEYRDRIKAQIQQTIDGLEKEKAQVSEALNAGRKVTGIHITIGNDQEALTKILGVFYNKLYALDSYVSIHKHISTQNK